jgi:hypothetical protein
VPTARSVATPQEEGLHAFVDESMRIDGNSGTYLLAAVVCDTSQCDPVREMLRSLRYRRQPRLHWSSEEGSRKAKIAESIGALNLPATVVIGMPLAKSKQERARAKCMEALLPEMQNEGVSRVWLEARTPSLQRRDQRLIDAIRAKGLIGAGIRVDPARPSEEPMLWLPDAVAGAVGAAQAGQPEYLALIGTIQEIHVSTL